MDTSWNVYSNNPPHPKKWWLNERCHFKVEIHLVLHHCDNLISFFRVKLKKIPYSFTEIIWKQSVGYLWSICQSAEATTQERPLSIRALNPRETIFLLFNLAEKQKVFGSYLDMFEIDNQNLLFLIFPKCVSDVQTYQTPGLCVWRKQEITLYSHTVISLPNSRHCPSFEVKFPDMNQLHHYIVHTVTNDTASLMQCFTSQVL